MTTISYQRNNVVLNSNDTQEFSRTARTILHNFLSSDAGRLSHMENALKAIPYNNRMPEDIDQRNFAR